MSANTVILKTIVLTIGYYLNKVSNLIFVIRQQASMLIIAIFILISFCTPRIHTHTFNAFKDNLL